MPAKMSLERIAKALTEALNADETTMHLALQTLQLGYTLGQQDSRTIFYQLEKDAQYALNSHSRNLVYQTYGAAKMARQLDAITALQFDRLNEMLVVKGLNDPAHCYLE